MLRSTILATAIIAATGLGTAGAAFAQSGPRLIGGADDMVIVYDNGTQAPQAGTVGGGAATIAGGGDNRVITYGGQTFGVPGQIATISGGGDNRVITYQQATPAPTGFAGTTPTTAPRG
jgi:hypothetical protein